MKQQNILETTSLLTLDDVKSKYFNRLTGTPQRFSFVSSENTSPTLIGLINPHKKTRPLISTPKGSNQFTPDNKTQMFLTTEFGPFTLLLDEDISQDNPSQDIILSSYDQVKAILKPPEEKIMAVTFGLDDVNKIAREKKANNGKRLIRQEAAMVADGVAQRLASSNKIARKLNLLATKALSHEWTHLVAHRYTGKAGQVAKNLVLATRACNSLMLMIEEKISMLLILLNAEFPENNVTVTLNVKSETYPGTHVGTCIIYHIITKVDDVCVFNLKVKFDPMLQNDPTRTWDIYITALFNYALRKQGELISFDSPPSPQDEDENESTQPYNVDDITPTQLNFC